MSTTPDKKWTSGVVAGVLGAATALLLLFAAVIDFCNKRWEVSPPKGIVTFTTENAELEQGEVCIFQQDKLV